jgi:hypothetical protein
MKQGVSISPCGVTKRPKRALAPGPFLRTVKWQGMTQFWIFDFGFSIVGTSLPSQEIPFAILESNISNPNLKFYRMSIASP